MAEIFHGVLFITASGVIVYTLSLEHKKYQEERNKRIEERNKRWEKSINKNNKRNFINSYIDEIPELSYYEAAQLKKKLGDIYIQWNNE